jgi:formylglycine-generating enzyme required for sulfatase activity
MQPENLLDRGSADSFCEKVGEHLRKVVHQIAPPVQPPKRRKPAANPEKYLRDLHEKTGYIDIRGLVESEGRAHRFPIEDLFISLSTSAPPERRHSGLEKRGKGHQSPQAGDMAEIAEMRSVPLAWALRYDLLVIVGDPGAGKTTFLRRVAHALCQTELGTDGDAAKQLLGIENRTFPILLRISDLTQHFASFTGEPSAPQGDDTPAWLLHFLRAASKANHWDLDVDFFRAQLERGRCTVLLDGLDEAPDEVARQRVTRWIENVTKTYGNCRWVVTTRPSSYTGSAQLADFAHARIDPLSDEAVATFLSHWCSRLYPDSGTAATEHCRELLAALEARPEIRRMARNPVMLTALAVVHWNEHRLPEQRADLYESIIRWLSRSRPRGAERPKSRRAVELLQELALRMQSHPDGMQTKVTQRWAAEQLAAEWTPPGQAVTKGSIAQAVEFLDAEELDSGIVVSRGRDIQFWHRTFQEFLAARAIAARPDAEQEDILWGQPARFDQPEWREVMLLLGGILHEHGRAKVDQLFRRAIGRLGPAAELADQARCAGLLGAVVRDLAPVDYQPPDRQYQTLLEAVQAIFDRDASQQVPVAIRIAAADAWGQAGDPRPEFRHPEYWVTIPAGSFRMGAQSTDPRGANYDGEAYEDESPVREVTLDAYAIGRYPVTVDQYRQFVEDEGYQTKRWWAAGFGEFREPAGWEDQLPYPSRPVVGVSWFEAAAFCAWAGVRLPTEAQWERAARGTTGRKFPWGDQPPDESRLNFAPDWKANVGHPTPVGIYPLGNTPEGICDLAGNVWEWCADWFAGYPQKAASNPTGPESGESRVHRGGGWANDARRCRSAGRNGIAPARRDVLLGFRVAPVPPGRAPPSSGGG